jgi:hypothetical protein
MAHRIGERCLVSLHNLALSRGMRVLRPMGVAVVVTLAFVFLPLVRLVVLFASLVVAALLLVARPFALLDQVVVFVGEGNKCG